MNAPPSRAISMAMAVRRCNMKRIAQCSMTRASPEATGHAAIGRLLAPYRPTQFVRSKHKRFEFCEVNKRMCFHLVRLTNPKLMTMSSTGKIRGDYSPDRGVKWLLG